MKILLDTHAWLWWIAGSSEIGKQARLLLSGRGTLAMLSPISIWEFLILVEKKRIRIKRPGSEWIEEALAKYPVEEAVLTGRIAAASRSIAVKTEDPADRFIAATALVHGVPLLTADKTLLAARGLQSISALK